MTFSAIAKEDLATASSDGISITLEDNFCIYQSTPTNIRALSFHNRNYDNQVILFNVYA